MSLLPQQELLWCCHCNHRRSLTSKLAVYPLLNGISQLAFGTLLGDLRAS